MSNVFIKKNLPKVVLLCLVLLVSLLFMRMISQFLMAIFMAGLLSAIIFPIHNFLCEKFNGRRNIAAVVTVLSLILLILLPFSILLTMVISQAVDISQSVTPWVQTFIDQPTIITTYLENLPFYEEIEPYKEIFLRKVGSMVGSVSSLFINSFSSLTQGTFEAIFSVVIMLYVMFYFLNMGHILLNKILYFLPLDDVIEQQLLRRFTSVTRATLKGVVIIGLMQGLICGTAFAFAGIQGPVFWGTIMAFTSIIPVFGAAIVWGPALLILLLNAQFSDAAILAVVCGLVAGNLDNIVRPRLVGKDTEMHDLFVLFGTLGGISMFGFPGIIIGPIITALFITLWEIYGNTFRYYLPETGLSLHREHIENTDKKKVKEYI